MSGIFTLLYDQSYLPGALVLGLRLKQLSSPPVTGILIDKSSFTEHQLLLISSIYDDVVDFQPLISNDPRLSSDLNRPTLNKTWSKIYLWSLLSYDKILYLDADTLPSITDFDITNILKLDFPQHKILASPDSGFPDIFNSGVFALKPNLHDFNQLLNLVKFGHDISFDGADQGLLNQYFNNQVDWVYDYLAGENSDNTEEITEKSISENSSSNWIKLPFIYNCTPSAQYQYLPGYNYFIRPTVPRISDGLRESDADILDSVNQARSGYNLTALNYVKSNSQIKLIHFIGPIKPWNESQADHGIFGPWWDVWHKHFPGKSISDVVNGTETFSEPQEEVQVDHENVVVEEQEKQPEEPEHVQPFDPSELLNPENYQQFDNSITQSNDSSWDATREPPPTNTSVPEFTDLGPEVHAFTNKWDETEEVESKPPPPPSEEEEKVEKEEVSEEYHYPGINFNTYTKPERVFDSGEDYYPVHRLQAIEKIPVEPEPVEEPITLVSNVNIVNEQLTKLGFIEDRGFELVYDEDQEDDGYEQIDTEDQEDEPYESPAPKLFPWEFKKGNRPERVFYEN